MKATVTITLKPGLLDAQGRTIRAALESLGFTGVRDVRIGKHIEVDLNHAGVGAARRDVERMCRKLLANPIIEHYRIEIAQGSPARQSREPGRAGLGAQGKRRAVGPRTPSSEPRARLR